MELKESNDKQCGQKCLPSKDACDIFDVQNHARSCMSSCVPQKKSTPLLLASITLERWFGGTHMRSRSCMKTPCFQGLYASKQLQKNRTTSYKFETNNRRSGPKGRGFESRHFDQQNRDALLGVPVLLIRMYGCRHAACKAAGE